MTATQVHVHCHTCQQDTFVDLADITVEACSEGYGRALFQHPVCMKLSANQLDKRHTRLLQSAGAPVTFVSAEALKVHIFDKLTPDAIDEFAHQIGGQP